ncbi:MAG: DNA mismatch repair endonuclease MutL [Spirochaetes bacterium]|jgi:DNA mismatch repair protein MutL|nr:DNA mismatch repair endonuclease MutL [Spirochaetota bacterium]
MNATHIRELPDHVKRMIAAGEVIEGPHSVVKELIENSIDSEADRITIKIEDGGMQRIVVTDNGCGIVPEELSLAIAEHATSKIGTVDDIQSIYSYGFRGEALSSIASISHITILSKPDGVDTGARLICRESIEIAPFAGPTGTTVIVEHLFYNTPARKKFMKARSTEIRKIRESCTKLALAHPEIAFVLESDGKQLFSLQKTETVRNRISDLFGGAEGESLYSGSVSDMQVSLTGYISSPSNLKRSRLYQHLFVNNRPVDYRNLSFHANRAYDAMLPHGSHPALYLFLQIPPNLIDVNVHPCKREIKLFDSRYIESLIYGFIKKTLGEHELSVGSVNLNTDRSSDSEIHDINSERQTTAVFKQAEKIEKIETGETNSPDIFKDGRSLYNDLQDWNYLGTIFRTYILIEKDNSLKILDFHAAHERIQYDRLRKNVGQVTVQKLIFPEEYSVTPDKFSILTENLDLLRSLGFDIDIFSEESLIINGVPIGIDPGQATICIDQFLEAAVDVTIDKNAKDYFDEIRDRAIERIACHSAKRAGDPMNRSDAEALISMVFSGAYELRCPHGRPFVVDISRSELVKLFRR